MLSMVYSADKHDKTVTANFYQFRKKIDVEMAKPVSKASNLKFCSLLIPEM
jgi:hypothetical protein